MKLKRLACLYSCLVLGSATPILAFSAQDKESRTVGAISVQHASRAPSLIEVGRGEMDWLWLSLYKAKLMTATGRYQQGQYPILLEIEYYRDIDSDDLLQATRDQWKQLRFSNTDIEGWLSVLRSIWPDVKQGDHLSFMIVDGQTSQFFYNQQPLNMINDTHFAEAFLAIWLSPQTSGPSLRAQLLGETSCDC
ncbi:chalcone isomerase family protein [Shewanella profunda]|uniref:chalcone isomerase family protein n=1 Tax=Shewanella profunda TaxID=254793 RepID=UPI00200F0E4B|nr:chalcone isomerase family protein [Shewanella profunda]MCL1089982.1 chalcone isomerase family protein [Shewanella profunda]